MLQKTNFMKLSMLIITISFLACSCKENPETFAIHSPIYPASGNQVTYTLSKIDGDVSEVKLYNTINTIDNSGTITTAGSETLLQTWSNPAFPINFTTTSGYGANKLVEYRFEVSGNGHTYNHKIRFATSPYPVANAAIPIYAVGDVDRVMNVVFIPDQDMTSDLNLFYTNVGEDIDGAFHREDWVRRFRNSYNFYINPASGQAGDANVPGSSHAYPSNDAELDFAQGRIILHAANRRDFSDGRYVGTEYYNRGTILHETGHLLYGMADEYGTGSHWQNTDLPNNWSSLAGAQSAAPGYGKTSADAVQIGTDPWWKDCNRDCIMLNTGLNVFPYDVPCQNRILYKLIQRSQGN